MGKHIITLLLLHICLFSFSQDMSYGIFTKQQRDITKEKTYSAKTLSDINPRYKDSWVKEYVSTEISVKCNGEDVKAAGTDNTLNEEQRRLIQLADMGSDISVVVNYYPDNKLIKELKKEDFSFKIIPSQQAQFPGGEEASHQYLTASIIASIDTSTLDDVKNVRVAFSIDENGDVQNTKLTIPSGNKEVDELVIEKIQSMPRWTAAKNIDGSVYAQDFELFMGGFCNMPRAVYALEGEEK